jgi:hypothetical protein
MFAGCAKLCKNQVFIGSYDEMIAIYIAVMSAKSVVFGAYFVARNLRTISGRYSDREGYH